MDHRLGDDQVRLKLLGRLLDARGQVHHVADDGVFLALAAAHVAGKRLSQVQADAEPCGRDAFRAVHLPDPEQNGARGFDGVPALLAVVHRSTEHSHETVAQKLVDDAAMVVDQRDHEAKQGVEIIHHLGRRTLAGDAAEVADVEEHYAHVPLLSGGVQRLAQQEVCDLRRDVLAENADRPVALLDRLQRAQQLALDLLRHESGNAPACQEEGSFDHVLVRRVQHGQHRRFRSDRRGIPIAGGHTIDSVEPIYGLVAIGLVDPKRVKSNAAAQAGDILILGKPIGVGILSAALKKDMLSPSGYEEMIANTTKLNSAGPDLAKLEGVHALTDVTGFGLAGHTLELARGSNCTAQIDWSLVPLLSNVQELANQGIITGASERNWQSYGKDVLLPNDFSAAQQALLSDPQTSGGLLVSCAPESVDEALAIFQQHQFFSAQVIGKMTPKQASSLVVFT